MESRSWYEADRELAKIIEQKRRQQEQQDVLAQGNRHERRAQKALERRAAFRKQRRVGA